MLTVPAEIRVGYAEFLSQRGVARPYINGCQKWLRFYLDFCYKYQHKVATPHSMSAFLVKLTEKKQGTAARKKAQRAIELYVEFLALLNSNNRQTTTTDQEEQEPVFLETNVKGSAGRTITSDRLTTFPTPQVNLHKAVNSWQAEYTRFENAIRLRHYSDKTLKSYRRYIRDFQTHTKSMHPEQLSSEHVKAYLTYLAVQKKVSASTQNLAFNALLFFFRHVLNREFGAIDGVVRAKRNKYIPVVLSRAEIDSIFDALDEPYLLVVKLLYGCGLRLSECLSLRVQCLNFEENILTIHDGKGKRDRTVPLPRTLRGDLRRQLNNVSDQHKRDIAQDYGGVFLFGAYERKSKNAARQFIWQWLFPAHKLTKVKATGESKRHHLHETHVQKALRRAVEKVRLTKRVTAHTFRHSYASHLLQANYDIRTIQKLLGHSDVRTTMIYTHTVKSTTRKETKSPLDF